MFTKITNVLHTQNSSGNVNVEEGAGEVVGGGGHQAHRHELAALQQVAETLRSRHVSGV